MASTSEQENYILKRKIDPILTDLGPTQFLSVRPQGVLSSIDSSVSIVILNIPTFSFGTRSLIVDARRLGYKGPVLIVSKIETPELLDDVKALDHVVLLDKPYETKDLQGLVRKFIQDRTVQQRVHRRYNTVQQAHVEFLGKRVKTVTTLLNLSRGGCYFEFPRLMEIKPGDILRMTIELADVNRIYAMPARVIWTSTPSNGGHGIGVEFVGPGIMQSNPIGM